MLSLRIRVLASGLVALALFAISPIVADPAGAAVHSVTNGNDSGAGSFRQAVLDANADVDPSSSTSHPGSTSP